jgi:hypothetical protein
LCGSCGGLTAPDHPIAEIFPAIFPWTFDRRPRSALADCRSIDAVGGLAQRGGIDDRVALVNQPRWGAPCDPGVDEVECALWS